MAGSLAGEQKLLQEAGCHCADAPVVASFNKEQNKTNPNQQQEKLEVVRRILLSVKVPGCWSQTGAV